MKRGTFKIIYFPDRSTSGKIIKILQFISMGSFDIQTIQLIILHWMENLLCLLEPIQTENLLKIGYHAELALN